MQLNICELNSNELNSNELNSNELNINELNSNELNYMGDRFIYEQQTSFEQIPENTVPIKVIKKGVYFEEPLRPTHQPIPKVYAKMVRPQPIVESPKISYEDILSKMGMFVCDGKLHLVDRNTEIPQKSKVTQVNKKQQQTNTYTSESNIPQNSYIYNKFFNGNSHSQNNIRQPKTLAEYKRMVINDYIQKQRIKQIKSTKLIMPTSNIHISPGNSTNFTGLQNKLFHFSKR